MPNSSTSAKTECERLLWDFHQGKRQPVLTPEARIEQGREPLREEDLAVAERLLAAPSYEFASLIVDEVGDQRCAEVLHDALPNWLPTFAGSSVASIYPFLELTAPDLHWLVSRIDFGITGIRVHSSVWSTWKGELPGVFRHTPTDSSPPYTEPWWGGFAEVTDDLNTRYGPPSRAIEMARPVPVTVGAQTELRWGQLYRDAFRPGLPSDARFLYLSPIPHVRIDQPYAADQYEGPRGLLSVTHSWSRDVSLDRITFELDLLNLRSKAG